MKRTGLAPCAILLLSTVTFAQQDPSEAPASKEDVQRYMDVMHLEKMMHDGGDGKTDASDLPRSVGQRTEHHA